MGGRGGRSRVEGWSHVTPWRRRWRTPTRDSDVPLAALPQVLGTHLVTAFSPGGAQPASLSAPPTQPLPERPSNPKRAHRGAACGR